MILGESISLVLLLSIDKHMVLDMIGTRWVIGFI
jgi:hypothetical protein